MTDHTYPIELEHVLGDRAGHVEQMILPKDPGDVYLATLYLQGQGTRHVIFDRTDRWRTVDGLRAQVYRERIAL